MTDPNPKLFGVWLPGVGWLKTHAGAVAFVHKDVADSVAGRIGQKASAEFIDDSIKDLEQALLAAEQEQKKRTIWHILTRYFGKHTPNP